jgi:hypothetical protein
MSARPFITGKPLNSKLFTWHNGHGCAEISSLRFFSHHQVWLDSADVGFTIESDRTHRQITFVSSGERKEDGEVLSWFYMSIDARTGCVDKTKNALCVTLYND